MNLLTTFVYIISLNFILAIFDRKLPFKELFRLSVYVYPFWQIHARVKQGKKLANSELLFSQNVTSTCLWPQVLLFFAFAFTPGRSSAAFPAIVLDRAAVVTVLHPTPTNQDRRTRAAEFGSVRELSPQCANPELFLSKPPVPSSKLRQE